MTPPRVTRSSADKDDYHFLRDFLAIVLENFKYYREPHRSPDLRISGTLQ